MNTLQQKIYDLQIRLITGDTNVRLLTALDLLANEAKEWEHQDKFLTLSEISGRIKETPDSCNDYTLTADFSGLNDINRLILIVAGYSMGDLGVRRKDIEQITGWNGSYIKELRKQYEHLGLELISLFCENDGMYYGRGYSFNTQTYEKALTDMHAKKEVAELEKA
ncbi:hypothetical protein V6R21_06385 [Limibacter armeniacum]|uniref:hypothetical protein n=1 Tax=Limibacter armeniacum TaxID=466084 RepID=UPI002FE620E1